MTQPTYRNAALFLSSFAPTLSGNFDVGAGPNTTILAFAWTASNSTTTIDSLVIGGVTMTAESASEAVGGGYVGHRRAFRLVDQSMTGSQAFTLTMSDENAKPTVVFYSCSNSAAIGAYATASGLSANVAGAVASDANSLVAGLFALDHGGTVAADSPTVERLEAADGNLVTAGYAMDEPGASGTVTLSATVTGGATPPWFGGVWSVQGSGGGGAAARAAARAQMGV